jgi:hypothetical protein
METKLDWQKLDIIRLFLAHQEEEFKSHLEEYGFDPSEEESYRENIMQALWDMMEETL